MTRRAARRGMPGVRRQRGVSLIEALIAFLVMGLGLLSVIGVQSALRFSSDIAKQRSEAVRLAQEEMARMRAFAVLTSPGARPAYEDIVDSASTNVQGVTTNTTFAITREVSDDVGGLKTVRVTVQWDDRRGGTPRVALQSVISAVDPKLSGLLGIAPLPPTAVRPGGRSPGVPINAHDLGDGRSVFKPSPRGTVAWVFNNTTGVVTSRCIVAVDADNDSLDAEDLSDESCDAFEGTLIAGFVVFTDANPATAADAELPTGLARNLDMTLALTGPNYPSPAYECFDDAPASQVEGIVDVAYFCVVRPQASTGTWSGRLNVSPVGFAIGVEDGQFRICRYSADYDGDGTIENAEHPDSYTAVGTYLLNQNFLVVPGLSACPTDTPVDIDAGDLINSNTIQHQPVVAAS